MSNSNAFVSWPTAPLTLALVQKALSSLPVVFDTAARIPDDGSKLDKLVQWSTYDKIDHDLTYASQHSVLSCSYIIRKALIRKHFLARCVQSYLAKHPDSVLRNAVPKTWELEISFADELDDMWADDLWDLGLEMDDETGGTRKWWILKPGMADRGQGIRLVDSKEALQQVFEDFEGDEENGETQSEGEDGDLDTAVIMSQLRHFVIQEYISTPLLLDPYQVLLDDSIARPLHALKGHKFHLRAYCIAQGALKVYLYTRVLALFSSKPYFVPTRPNSDSSPTSGIDLAPHLTNTALQTHRGEEGVRLFDELVGCQILSQPTAEGPIALTAVHIARIQDQMADILAETFKAALETPVHFQPLPNAFELYGADFLVSHSSSSESFSEPSYQVQLLEINAEPAIELTGARLTWILEDLFEAIGTVCVLPFVQDIAEDDWIVGETRHLLRKCLDSEVRGAGGW